MFPDVITCAKFQDEILTVTTLQGWVEFSIFLLIIAWSLQRCSANALPVMRYRTLANYVIWNVFKGLVGRMPKRFVDLANDFVKVVLVHVYHHRVLTVV